LVISGATAFIAINIFGRTALGDPAANRTAERDQNLEERRVFITGSLIPQRIQLRPIGTTTVSPIRIIDRREIDQTGRRTTLGALVNEPSLRIIGH
jgi:methyl coenzyme M reductase subunit D